MCMGFAWTINCECARAPRHWQVRACVLHLRADVAEAQWLVFCQAPKIVVRLMRGHFAGVCFDDMSYAPSAHSFGFIM